MALRFGDYEVEKQLGPGGVTETYRAHRHGNDDQPVALKLLRGDRVGKDPRIASLFVNLGLRNGELKVPGVARVLEVSGDPGASFVITEYVPGVNLESLWDNAVAGGGLDANLVSAIGSQIARILTALHERKDRAVHGGLCPGNVLVTPEGKVVLTDIGFSAALRNVTEFAADKYWFVAPELLLSKAKPTPASDLYSLGAILYYLLSGEAPIIGETRAELIEQLEEPIPNIPNVPDWLELAITNLLSKNPDDRPRTSAAAALALSPPPSIGLQLGNIVSGKPQTPSVAKSPPPAAIPARTPARAPVRVADSEPELPDLDALPGLDLLEGPASGARPVPQALPRPRAPVDDGMGSDFIGNANDGSTSILPSPIQSTKLGIKPPPIRLSAESSVAEQPLKPLATPPAPSMRSAVPSVGRSEPQWVDDVGGGGPAANSVDDDFFDLPSATGRPNILVAGMDVGPRTMDLHVPDLPSTTMNRPRVLDMPNASGSRESDGIYDPEDRGAGTIDPNKIGILSYESDDDNDNERLMTGDNLGTMPGGLPLPRRAGSARVGGPKKQKSTSPLFMIAAVTISMGIGYVFYARATREPLPVAPPRTVQAAPDPSKPTAEDEKRQKAQEESMSPARGQLTIETTPKGATVWLDGVEKGKTPVVLQTNPDTHRLVITKPGFKMLRQVADTSEGLTMKRTLPPANINFGGTVSLQVSCTTEGKYPVFIDGRDTGLLCPVENLMVPEGNRLIGLYVIPQNKVWSFEREIMKGSQSHKVIFNY
ncbi:MAG: protein kinase [Deltaproteobacteria bacterium]|nr:protein kinase [Deltaproteobacteria bacterium]